MSLCVRFWRINSEPESGYEVFGNEVFGCVSREELESTRICISVVVFRLVSDTEQSK